MALTKVQKEGIETLINNNADNRVITGSGTANTLNGESSLTWNGSAMGVGLSSPSDTLHVFHATDNLVARFESGDTGGGITLKDNTHVTSLLTTNGAFEINVDQGGDISGETISFKMSGTTKASIDSTGDLTISDGDLVIGTAAHGIDFSAQTASSASGTNATSELLDHYEEGTWTPAYESSGGTYGYTTQTGYYTKVGNVVTVAAYIRTSSVSASSHNLVKVTGLPFAEGKGQRTPGSVRSASFQSSGTLEGFPIVWTVEANQSFGELLRFTSSGTTDFTSSTMNNETFVYLQCTYHAA